MSTLERLLDVYIPTLFKETERFAQIKLLSASLEVLDGTRQVARAYFYSLIWSTVFTAATFSIVLYCVMEYASKGAVRVDGFLVFASVIWAFSLGIAVSLLRERRWLSAFGVQQKLDAISSLSASRVETQASRDVLTTDAIAAMIDRLLEARLAKLADSAKLA